MNDDKEKQALEELREKKLPGITAGETQEFYREWEKLREKAKREQEKKAEKVK